jgi:hypothetical protein
MPLIMPAPSGVLPVLAPLAAVGLAAVMVGVAASHLHLHELRTATANLVIPAVCVVVAVAQFAGL